MTSKKHRHAQALQNQIGRLERRLTQLYHLSNRYAQIRLAIFILAALLTAALIYGRSWWEAGLNLVLSGLAFGVAVYQHGRIETSLLTHQIWLEIKATHLARMHLDWAKLPNPSASPPSADHPFSLDFDLTGPRSLHHLLDTTTSQEASLRLQAWLLEMEPDLATIQQRQTMVQALILRPLFCDKLTLKARLARTGMVTHWQGQRLLSWLESKEADPHLWPLVLGLGGVGLINLILFGLFWLNLLPAWWLGSLLLYLGLSYTRWREIVGLFDSALTLRNGLEQLQAVFAYLEQTPHIHQPALKTLCQPFLDPSHRPSTKLGQVNRLAGAAGLASTPILGLALNLIGPWNLYLAHRLNQLQDDLVQDLPHWLEAWFELEALCALATFSYLNSGYVFPHLTAPEKAASLFTAQNLSHPLIQDDQKVGNDFLVPRLGDMGLITGSNMSGKSTFMRTVGINLRLAYAGAVVDARAMQTILFRLFACLKVSDSVIDGFSYFYAEVRRLKALLTALEQEQDYPLFFFIDEIFRGTNNRERLIGSQAFIRAVVGKHGYGFVATHDLALVALADETDRIKNYHFRDQVSAGHMVFDYILRPGPCPTTNALHIMRLAGLPVEAAGQLETDYCSADKLKC